MADQDNNGNAQAGGSKMPLLALAFTNLLSLGGLAYLVLVDGGDQAAAGGAPAGDVAPPADEVEAAPMGPLVELGTYSITLADPGQNRYLKAVLKGRVDGGDAVEEIEAREPEVRDRIIDYLSSLTVKETQGSTSKSVIRKNLEKRINNILRSGEVESIFLTEFVTQ